MGNVVHVELGGDEQLPRRVGYLIDDDDLRPSQLRELDQKSLNRFCRRRCRQYDGGLGIAKRRIETFGMARQFGANSGTAMVPALIAAKNPAT